jgi:hypothetical protein
MVIYQIVAFGNWYQIVEAGPDGDGAAIGCFRTAADAQSWLNTYVWLQSSNNVASNKVATPGWSKDDAIAAD